MKKTVKDPQFLTPIEAANLFRVSDRCMRDLIKSGEVKAVRLGKKIVRVPRAEVDRLIDATK